ncbi:hypothetical protein Syun_021115 [Stephania yunnanensis]|uniref:Glucan endo-1,3-beta-D-glucosidase n=1 Tax=Stephania yunnanensis TaxID=152371 RepID=A0AAP0IG00_9MAGN
MDMVIARKIMAIKLFLWSRALPIRGSRTEPITYVQDLDVQSQALFNIKDLNKVSNLKFYSRSRLKGWSCCRSKHVTGAGDEIWRYVGKLTDAQKSMLDDRFKWKAREMDKRREGKPGEARAVLRRSVRDNGREFQESIEVEASPSTSDHAVWAVQAVWTVLRKPLSDPNKNEENLRRGLFTIINTATSFVGVNYGTIADNLPSPADAVSLMKANGITVVRLFEPNHDRYEALRGTSIKVSLGVLNDDLPGLASASVSATSGWLETQIFPFVNDVSFAYITLGNEAIPGPKAQYVYTAIQNMWKSLETFNFSSQILPTVVVPGGVLGVSYPPSQGAFADNVAHIMTDVTKLVYSIGVPHMVNVYPYFALVSDPEHIGTPFALFTSTDPSFVDGELAYYNLYDAIVDAFLVAMARVVGADDVKIMVPESGWPSAGNEPYTTIENAQTYNNNLKNRALSQGTPRRQSVLLDMFIFALFIEDMKGDTIPAQKLATGAITIPVAILVKWVNNDHRRYPLAILVKGPRADFLGGFCRDRESLIGEFLPYSIPRWGSSRYNTEDDYAEEGKWKN